MEISKLVAAGGKHWVSDDGSKSRVYFGDLHTYFGLHIDRKVGGGIAHAELNGESISHNRAYEIWKKWNECKFWYDVVEDKFTVRGIAQSDAQIILAAIKQKIAE